MGPPVFKTGDAALGVAWWVRLPCAPARRPDVSCAGRPTASPTAQRGAHPGHRSHGEAAGVRARGADGSRPIRDRRGAQAARSGSPGDVRSVPRRRRGRAPPRVRRAATSGGDQRDGRDRPHEPRSSAVARRSDRGGPGGRGEPAPRDRLHDGEARRPAPPRRGAPDRPDRGRGRARHEQQRRGVGASGWVGRPRTWGGRVAG